VARPAAPGLGGGHRSAACDSARGSPALHAFAPTEDGPGGNRNIVVWITVNQLAYLIGVALATRGPQGQ
jgi:hypothetical protein